MKFTIEVLHVFEDNRERVLARESINAIGPRWARAKARVLFERWKPRAANAVRVLNHANQAIYNWRGE